MKSAYWFPGLLLASLGVQAGLIVPVPEKIGCVVPDRQDHQIPDRVYLQGWLGSRLGANESNRLVRIDTSRLLEGYRQRPGRQAWDGEHVGKWLHAATLAWIYTGDPALRSKLDTTVEQLCKCQQEDGYLGTYLDKDRWTEWDVWAHKYNLIGLITYMRYTGNLAPLPACQRMANLLCATFGDQPGQRDILRAGHHVGMAPTSVLEPMVLLYRLTGEARYLQFCQYILRAWELPHGPRIISTLLTAKRVDKVGNGKAYEMLSCLNGALEYYRTVGEPPDILEACMNAWSDIVAKRLYITGAASYQELFHDDFDLPNTGNVGETCVTVTWLQFNAQLLRLTGEARFAEHLEQVCLNQLLGAQKPDGSAWGYYVQMEGLKPYSDTLDGHCCLSSGPRGVALIPTFAVTTDAQGLVVNLYDAGHANLGLRNGSVVSVNIDTSYPKDGAVGLTINSVEQATFTVKLRIPTWRRDPLLRVGGINHPIRLGRDGYAWITREWKPREKIELNFRLAPRVAMGDHVNQGKMAILYGPLVLAADQSLLGGSIRSLSLVSFAPTNLADLFIRPEPATPAWRTWPGAQLFRVRSQASKASDTLPSGGRFDIQLVPFADAGMTKANYKVWLPLRLSSQAQPPL